MNLEIYHLAIFLLGGFVGGLFGVGGGILFIIIIPPILIALGYSAEDITALTIANSFFGILFTSGSGIVASIKQKMFFFQESFATGFGALITALLVRVFIVSQPWYDQTKFTFVVIVILLTMLLRTFLNLRNKVKLEEVSFSVFRYLLIGAVGGIIASLSGFGGGIIMIPMLISLMKIDIKKAKAISLSVIFIIALSLTSFNLIKPYDSPEVDVITQGFIVLPLAIPLTLCVIIASPIGVWVSKKISSRNLTLAFTIFVFLIMIKKSLEILGIIG